MNVGNSNTFVTHGSLTGKLPGLFGGDKTKTLSFNPNNGFEIGEEIEVTLTTGLTTTRGVALDEPFVYRFRAEVTSGTGDFAEAATSPEAVGNPPTSVVAGDWNGDGATDFAVGTEAPNVRVFINDNDGSGDFTEAASSPEGLGNNPTSLTAGDWNGDGAIDFAVGTQAPNVRVFLNDNDGTGDFTEAATSPEALGSNPTSLTAGDWDGDGALDFAVATQAPDVRVFINDNDGTGNFSNTSTLNLGSNPTSVISGDWDGDGALDFAVATQAPDVRVFLNDNDGTGDFTEAATSPEALGNNPTSLTAGDWDGNGVLDFVVGTQAPDVRVFLNDNDGTGDFTEAATSPVALGSNPTSLIAGDWDVDRALDFAVGTQAPDVRVFLNDNNGTGDFTEAATSPEVLGNNPTSLTAGDWDGNGALDLAVPTVAPDVRVLLDD
jgi:hypothetical protein